MRKDTEISSRYVDVLDGIRALSILFVMFFHFWQQTWLFPSVDTPFLSLIGLSRIDLTPLVRTGYLFVDMMILISGFLLFLPVARNIVFGESMEPWGRYFKKRAVRILPSYLFCITVILVYELITGGFGDPVDRNSALSDLFLHLTFMHTWTVNSYLGTKLSTVLWTLGIEVWFYILFPVIAVFIRRRKSEKGMLPAVLRSCLAAAVLIGISLFYIHGYVLNSGSAFAVMTDNFLTGIHIGPVRVGIRSTYPAMVINQLPAFFEVYAVGLIGAFIYALASKHMKRKWWSGLIFTVLSLGFAVLIARMIKECASLDPELAQIWQVSQKLKLALAFLGFILSAAFASKPFRFLLSNRIMVFLSGISYNLYIWHQWLSVKIKYDWRIPYWTGSTPPNQIFSEKSHAWSVKYAIIILIAAFAAAILATYLIERPAADILNGRRVKLFKSNKKTAD